MSVRSHAYGAYAYSYTSSLHESRKSVLPILYAVLGTVHQVDLHASVRPAVHLTIRTRQSPERDETKTKTKTKKGVFVCSGPNSFQ